MHAAHILQKAQQWIAKTHPRYWNRRGGRDHIWTNVNDEGAAAEPYESRICLLPACVLHASCGSDAVSERGCSSVGEPIWGSALDPAGCLQHLRVAADGTVFAMSIHLHAATALCVAGRCCTQPLQVAGCHRQLDTLAESLTQKRPELNARYGWPSFSTSGGGWVGTTAAALHFDMYD